jgi:hypothetical protein
MGTRFFVSGCMLAALLLPAAVLPAAAQTRVGFLAGYSLVEQTDTSLSHGPLRDAATVGRTWVVGAVLDGRLTPRDVVSAEFVWGPYHNDMDRFCIQGGTTFECAPQVINEAAHAFVADLQYARLMGDSSWRPYVGGGFGLKRYSFKSGFNNSPKTSAALIGTVGVRSTGSRPLRIEVAAIAIPRHPILNDKTQFELQARVVALVF